MERRIGERFFAEYTDDLLEVVKAERKAQCEKCDCWKSGIGGNKGI